MTYAEAIQFLYDLRLFGAKFGLENTFKLAALAGNPQEELRFIHVAGTNGKGSTCAMLESIYRAAGLRVGLFTSPHLVSFRERIQVNRQMISENELVRLVKEMQPLLEKSSADCHPTFFEVVTIIALKFFAEQKCDLVIWETGLGGRFDATNIVTPIASVITNIALDHQQWLGNTIEKIASEKAGIIKPNVPVLTAASEMDALRVIENVAKERNAPLTKAGQAARLANVNATESPAVLTATSEMSALNLLGEHQKQNAALALAVVKILQGQIRVSSTAIQQGLSSVNWPGRLQLIIQPSQKILLDGAHNEAGVHTLAEALSQMLSGRKAAMILGILQDKDWRSMCEILLPLAKKVVFVPVQSERTASPHDLANVCRQINPSVWVAECSSLADAFIRFRDEPFVVVAGSLYLVGEALELLGQTAGAPSERGLNEWTTKSSHTADKQP